jgi:hypothetical protein
MWPASVNLLTEAIAGPAAQPRLTEAGRRANRLWQPISNASQKKNYSSVHREWLSLAEYLQPCYFTLCSVTLISAKRATVLHYLLVSFLLYPQHTHINRWTIGGVSAFSFKPSVSSLISLSASLLLWLCSVVGGLQGGVCFQLQTFSFFSNLTICIAPALTALGGRWWVVRVYWDIYRYVSLGSCNLDMPYL